MMYAFRCNRCKNLFSGLPLTYIYISDTALGRANHELSWSYSFSDIEGKCLDLCNKCLVDLMRTAIDEIEGLAKEAHHE